MISTTPTQKCLHTLGERQNFTAVREVINDLANPCNWVIVPRNQVGQDTNVQYVLSAMSEFDCGHLDNHL